MQTKNPVKQLSQFPIGSRVVYRHICKWGGPERTCTGTVTAHYPDHWWKDDETGERVWFQAHAGMKVDEIPAWWSYSGTDSFAPSIDELELLPQ